MPAVVLTELYLQVPVAVLADTGSSLHVPVALVADSGTYFQVPVAVLADTCCYLQVPVAALADTCCYLLIHVTVLTDTGSYLQVPVVVLAHTGPWWASRPAETALTAMHSECLSATSSSSSSLLFLYFLQLSCPNGISPMGNSGCLPQEKLAATEVTLPNLWCMLGVLVFP